MVCYFNIKNYSDVFITSFAVYLFKLLYYFRHIANSDLRYSITNMNKNIIQIPAKIFKAEHSNVYIIGKETGELKKMLKDVMKINVMDRLTSSITMAIAVETSKLIQVSYELLLAILHNIPIVTKECM